MLLVAAALGGCAHEGAAVIVTPWSPHGISSPLFESHAAFDPLTGDAYFVRSSPAFEGWRLYVSHCTASGWSEGAPAAFVGDGVEADPWFTRDGRTLYFISTRTADGMRRDDLDIFEIQRGTDGRFGMPVRLPTPINSPGNEWFPRLARDGWLYFGSNRPGGLGKTDIWRARQHAGGDWFVENLGPSINTSNNEFEAEPSPDGSTLIVMTDDGLYLARHATRGWSARQKLPSAINVNATEVGALFSPSGRTLLFSRDTQGPLSGEFFRWQRSGHEAWPTECRAAASGQE